MLATLDEAAKNRFHRSERFYLLLDIFDFGSGTRMHVSPILLRIVT